MAPWVIAGILSPSLALAVLAVVLICTTGLYLVARRAFTRLGVRRVVAGYLGVFAVLFGLCLVLQLVELLTWQDSVVVFLFLVYAACLALALIIVPLLCVLAARGRASAPWAILTSVLAGVVLAMIAYALLRSGVREERELRLLLDMSLAIPFLVIVGVGFALGARLPWTMRVQRA